MTNIFCLVARHHAMSSSTDHALMWALSIPAFAPLIARKTTTLVGLWLLAVHHLYRLYFGLLPPSTRYTNLQCKSFRICYQPPTSNRLYPKARQLIPSTFLEWLVKLRASFISPSQMTFFQEAGSKACGSYSAVHAGQEPPRCAQLSPTYKQSW